MGYSTGLENIKKYKVESKAWEVKSKIFGEVALENNKLANGYNKVRDGDTCIIV